MPAVLCSRPEGRQGLHDVFFRAVVQNAHTHFLPACDREFRNAYRIKFRAEPFFRVQAEILRLCRFFFLSGHKHHPVSVCPENKKFCIKSLPVPAKSCKKERFPRFMKGAFPCRKPIFPSTSSRRFRPGRRRVGRTARSAAKRQRLFILTAGV